MNNLRQVMLLVFISFLMMSNSQQAYSQCTNLFAFGTVTAPLNTTPLVISGCTFLEEYNTVNSVVAGETYQSSSSFGGCITVHSGTPGGPVVGFGPSPLSWTATVSGTYYIHYNTDCACGTATVCTTTSITCTSCGGGGGYDPCTSITPLTGCGTSVTANMSGTGAPWNVNACGWTTSGTEMIFSFTATASGIHSIDVTGASGGFVDFFWAPASAGCSSTGWNCINAVFTTGNYGSMNWVAGTTYYILLDPEGTGAYSYTFDVNCPNPSGPSVAGDCSSAIPVCTNLSFAVDPNGFGLVDELCTSCVANPSINPSSLNTGCLLSGELNSTWLVVGITANGTLEFSFGAPVLLGNCYDWVMWPYNPTTCADIVGNTLAPNACNWNSPCESFSGMATPTPATGSAGNFEPAINVTAGQQFIICFSNYSSALTSVPLNFFGTAGISCTVLPVEIIEFTGNGMSGYNELVWSTASEINNSHFEIERSADGIEFQKIGEVEGAGNNLSLLAYSFNDYSPNVATNYYRLKQVDFNNAFSYSDIISISQKQNNDFTIVSSYPNPTKTNFNVQLWVPHDELIEVTINDIFGKKIDAFNKAYEKGNNLIQISVSTMAKGIYTMSINSRKTQKKEIIKFAVY